MRSSYSLARAYAGQSLISGFDFVDFKDPTHGFVSYQNYDNAVAQNLVSVDPSTQVVTLSADTTSKYDPSGSQGGRPSVRIESIEPVNKGLVIGDFAHIPGSVCGGWPAFWMYGPNWPNSGEVDIIEGANMAYENLMSAHTSAGCTLPSSSSSSSDDGASLLHYSGTPHQTDCDSTYFGCSYVAPDDDTSSYGDTFNAVGGGVYALDWTAEAIRVWHFPRASIPADITAKRPDPSSWGTPQALWGADGCDVESHFANMSIVLNIDFCGDYAGGIWSTGTCKNHASTCNDWVGNHPEQLKSLYWEINYIDVYNAVEGPADDDASSPSSSPTTTAVPTSSPSVITEASSAPTPTTTIDPNPANIGAFSYLGCFSSDSGYDTFNLSSVDPAMTPETCTRACRRNKYAGVIDDACYCADALDAGTSALPDPEDCSTPCPGNSTETCGGLRRQQQQQQQQQQEAGADGQRSTRAAGLPDTALLSMYANLDGANSTDPLPAPALGSNDTTTTAINTTTSRPYTNSSSSLPLSPSYAPPSTTSNHSYAHSHSHSHAYYYPTITTPTTETITTTLTYTTICPTDPARLITTEYHTTATITNLHCACTEQQQQDHYHYHYHTAAAAATPFPNASSTAAVIPLTTLTQECSRCGAHGESTVTLTVPVAVVVTQTMHHHPQQSGNHSSAPAVATTTAGGGHGDATVPTAWVVAAGAARVARGGLWTEGGVALGVVIAMVVVML